jgi:hypothetical protein
MAACPSPPPSPFFGDERFLRLGVEPDREADQLEQQLQASGFEPVLRFRGQHFHALGFLDRSGRRALVRVVTVRGIELALDPQPGDDLQPSVRYRLLAAPLPETHDADGDGFEEIFVERIAGQPPLRCVQVYRVRDSGFVDLVSVPEGYGVVGVDQAGLEAAWREPVFCDVEPAALPPSDGGAPLDAPDGGDSPPAP